MRAPARGAWAGSGSVPSRWASFQPRNAASAVTLSLNRQQPPQAVRGPCRGRGAQAPHPARPGQRSRMRAHGLRCAPVEMRPLSRSERRSGSRFAFCWEMRLRCPCPSSSHAHGLPVPPAHSPRWLGDTPLPSHLHAAFIGAGAPPPAWHCASPPWRLARGLLAALPGPH